MTRKIAFLLIVAAASATLLVGCAQKPVSAIETSDIIDITTVTKTGYVFSGTTAYYTKYSDDTYTTTCSGIISTTPAPTQSQGTFISITIYGYNGNIIGGSIQSEIDFDKNISQVTYQFTFHCGKNQPVSVKIEKI